MTQHYSDHGGGSPSCNTPSCNTPSQGYYGSLWLKCVGLFSCRCMQFAKLASYKILTSRLLALYLQLHVRQSMTMEVIMIAQGTLSKLCGSAPVCMVMCEQKFFSQHILGACFISWPAYSALAWVSSWPSVFPGVSRQQYSQMFPSIISERFPGNLTCSVPGCFLAT